MMEGTYTPSPWKLGNLGIKIVIGYSLWFSYMAYRYRLSSDPNVEDDVGCGEWVKEDL